MALLDYDTALAMLLGQVTPRATETAPLWAAAGRVLAAEIRADRDQPPFDRSAVDGYAVCSGAMGSSTGGESWPVDGVVSAGAERRTFEERVKPGHVRRIATGAPVPVGTDAVVPVEQTAASGPERVRITAAKVEPGQNVHRRASDAREGEVVMQPGVVLRAQHVGIAAAVGCRELTVYRQPRVVLLTTGDEVVDPATPTAELEPQQIRNANGPMLAAMLKAAGAVLVRHEHVADDAERTRAAAGRALADADMVLTVGGVSVGERDHLPATWRELGLQTIIHGVAIQPGKPVLAARQGDGWVLGLPGNPVSGWTTAHLFLGPMLQRMQGRRGDLPWRPVRLHEAVNSKAKREVFRAASLSGDRATAAVLAWHGSGDLVHTAAADGLVRLPRVEGKVPAGTAAQFLGLMDGN